MKKINLFKNKNKESLYLIHLINMGKKMNIKKTEKKGTKGPRELQPKSRTLRIHLHKLVHGIKFKHKAPRAIREIKEMATKMMFTKDVRIDPDLNKEIWKNGIRNLDRRIEVIMERKKNEEEDEEEQKMYTLVKLAPMAEV